MEIREVFACFLEVNKALVDSMQLVLCTLSQCFSCMEVKGEPVRITQACSDLKNFGSVIQQNLTYEKINKKYCQSLSTFIYSSSWCPTVA